VVVLRRSALGVAGLLAALLGTRVARGDNLADEADLRFQLAAEAYQKGDYRAALEQFLASNRLVPNKNVVFNIARSYEKLGRFPEAYLYYDQALGEEQDVEVRDKLKSALARIQPNVAILRVDTDPPGATLYVDRKDLGPRGNSPRKLGVVPGRNRVIAELDGHRPAETWVERAELGRETQVRLVLQPILGTVKVASPRDATVKSRDVPNSAPCTVPCALRLPPGRHQLDLELAGHRPVELPVDVPADKTVTVAPRLERLTGDLTVATDEPKALVEVDGKRSGLTPVIARLGVGEHRVRVFLPGFRPVERTVRIEYGQQTRLDLELTAADEVVAASRQSESVEDAPSSVSIISRPELRALAYPTIAEALRGVNGVYLWDDRDYIGIGIRGLGRMGAYGNRVLVLEDGQPTNDDWVGSSYVGYDGLTDLGDVERIEVVRGPGSALYGTGAFSGVINIVSRRDLPPGVRAGVSTNLDGVARARVRGDARLGQESGVWASAAIARSQGRDFYFPDFASAPTANNMPPGTAAGVDGFKSGTLRGRWWWRWATLQWYAHSHNKHLPGASFDAMLGDPRTRQQDDRAFLEARAEPKVSRDLTVLSRVHWNVYNFRGVYGKSEDSGGLEVDTFRGQWVGIEQRLVYEPSDAFRLTVGGEGQYHYLVEQRARDDQSGYFLDQSGPDAKPFGVGAIYLVGDAALGPRARLSAGLRADSYTTFGSSVNPRATLILRPYRTGNTKFILGKAFRAPSVYELYYNDGGYTQLANPSLRPESIYSTEIEHSHRFSPTVTATAAVYASYVDRMLDFRGQGTLADPSQAINSTAPLAIMGAELGIRREWRQGWMVGASYARSYARFLRGGQLEDILAFRPDPAHREVGNVPQDTASLKGAAPILARTVMLGSRLTLEGRRWDRHERVDDPDPQSRTDAAVLWDLVLSGHDERWNLDWALGAYNLFDWQYYHPIGTEFTQRTMLQTGRTFLASVEIGI
jgi:outer membrane receptor protein involved in Fe transport